MGNMVSSAACGLLSVPGGAWDRGQSWNFNFSLSRKRRSSGGRHCRPTAPPPTGPPAPSRVPWSKTPAGFQRPPQILLMKTQETLGSKDAALPVCLPALLMETLQDGPRFVQLHVIVDHVQLGLAAGPFVKRTQLPPERAALCLTELGQ